MKLLLCALAVTFSLPAVAARHPASQFMHNTLSEAIEIMKLKSETQRKVQLCALFGETVAGQQVGRTLLENYAGLARDMNAIQEFYEMVPSIVMGKALKQLGVKDGETVSGSFTVAENARSRGNGVYEVQVRATNKGKSYSGKAIIQDYGGGNYLLIDGEYLFFSAIKMIKGEYQDVLDAEYRKSPSTSLPVTALVQYVKGQSDYIDCP